MDSEFAKTWNKIVISSAATTKAKKMVFLW